MGQERGEREEVKLEEGTIRNFRLWGKKKAGGRNPPKAEEGVEKKPGGGEWRKSPLIAKKQVN